MIRNEFSKILSNNIFVGKKNIKQLLQSLWIFLGKKRKEELLLLLFLMVASSLSEILSIASLFSFIGFIATPEAFFKKPEMQWLISLLGAADENSLILPLTIIVSVAVIASCLLRLAVLKLLNKSGFKIGSDIGIEVYKRTLYQPFVVHMNRNSGEIISAITTKTNIVTYSIVIPLLSFLGNSLVLGSILFTLVFINPIVTLTTFCIYLFAYIYILRVTKSKKNINSLIISSETSRVVKLLQEGLGGIRDIILDNRQRYYVNLFINADHQLRDAQAVNQFISGAPRYIMECIGMLLIALLAFLITLWPHEISELIPLLAVLGVGAQRLLPVMQQIYVAWFSVASNQASLQDIIGLLEQPLELSRLEHHEPLNFEQGIELKNVFFRYASDLPWAIQNVSLFIAKGSTIGFIGKSGGGKSTLLDLIMGLMTPSKGELKVDGLTIAPAMLSSWYELIAHVPQDIFLADASISENIAFGTNKLQIDRARLIHAAKMAGIDLVIDSLRDRYETLVGERGVKLSGGQRQRIGIARALYKGSKIIVLDEATSALDTKTEHSVMSALNLLDAEITILIVAHRISTLANCDLIFELDGGVIKRVCKYSDIANEDPKTLFGN